MTKPASPKLRRTMDDPVLDRVLDEVLNGKVSVIPEFADLPRRWREAPAEASDRKHPREHTKDELVARYILLALTQPLAREGLRRLYLELTMNGEPVPDPLRWWNRRLIVLGDPPLKPGRPHKVDRDARISTVFKLLGTFGYSRENAIARIAETMGIPDETVRSIILKYRIHLRSR